MSLTTDPNDPRLAADARRTEGQQDVYLVLSEEERKRGFVRPVRQSYTHVGRAPKYPLRDLTEAEHKQYDQYGYVKYEAYPQNLNSGVTGRFWTQAMLDSLGCKTVTTMGLALAETYARDPKFYGSTFCVHCNKHFPVEEFVWTGTNETVGS